MAGGHGGHSPVSHETVSILTRPWDRIQFAKAPLPWGEARARECIPSDTRPSEQRSPGAKEPWPGGLRRIWVLASLLLGHRSTRDMLARRAQPEPKCGAANCILSHGLVRKLVLVRVANAPKVIDEASKDVAPGNS